MAKKFIDADALSERMRLQYCKHCDNYNGILCGSCDIDFAFDMVEDAPTADVVEVRHGRWERVRWVKCDDPDGGYWIVRCNQCSIPHFKEYNFCPSCGARMDGD